MNRISLKSVESSFQSWRFQDCLNLLGRKALTPQIPQREQLMAYQIGSLVFMGDLSEAIALFKNFSKKDFGSPEEIQARFYLGIGHVRRSEYSLGASEFAKNLLHYRKNKHIDSTARFHIHQGVAFLHFFKGYFERSVSFAKLSHQAALESDYTYGQVLALDLLGHCHCYLGKVRQGLHELTKGIDLIQEIGNGGLETALKVSLLRYRSQFGVNLKNALGELTRAIRELQPQETYSKAELHLELARQLILRGKATQAQKILDEANDLVYRHQNRRQSAIFNHRYAQLLFLRGEFHGALALLRSSLSQLDPKVDAVIQAQFAGLENKILRALGKPELEYTIATRTSLDLRIRERAKKRLSLTILKGEDILGDILDEIKTHGDELVKGITEMGLNGLIPLAIQSSSFQPQIFFGPGRGKMILISSGDVVTVDAGLTGPMKKLLKLMTGGKFKTKEELVQGTWGYKYDPRIHDNVLYSNVAKMRSLMKDFGLWIEWSPEGYRLADKVQIIEEGQEVEIKILPQVEKTTKIKKEQKVHLNLRQIKALRKIDQGLALDVAGYARKFKVCKMTACRDLTILFKKGLVVRVGKARATKYLGEKYL